MAEETEKRRLQRYCFALCNEAQIQRSDRLELAKALLDLGEFDLKTFNDLSENELRDIIFVLKGWRTIELLRSINGAQLAQARRIVREADFEQEPTQDEQSVPAGSEEPIQK